MVLAEVARVRGHLIDMRPLWGSGILELEHHHLRPGEDDDVRPAAPFTGSSYSKMISQRRPVAPSGYGGEALVENSELITPSRHLTGVGRMFMQRW